MIPEPSRGGLRWRLLPGLAVAFAAAAFVLIGHRGSASASASASNPVAARPATQHHCAPHQILRTEGPLVRAAHGTIAGQPWTLELDSARRGLRSVQAGRLLLGGRRYGFCKTKLDLELVNAGPRGIAYGLAARPYHPPIVIEGTTAHRTASHPAVALQYPATTRRVANVTVFLRALPASACAYRELAVVAPESSTKSGVSETALVFTGPFTRSCPPGQLRQTTQ